MKQIYERNDRYMPILDKNDKKMMEKYEKFLRNNDQAHMLQSPAWSKVKSDKW